MKLAILANDAQKKELLSLGQSEGLLITWWEELPLSGESPDVLLDLLFDETAQRVQALRQTGVGTILVNDVLRRADYSADGWIRVNGWNTFIQRKMVEAAGGDSDSRNIVHSVFALLNRDVEWVEDIPGFISARVVASIINEAYFTLQDKVSTAAEIDTAMKLGTNYPYGPFEWADKIGLGNIYALLSTLSQQLPRYTPSSLLQQQAG